METWEVKVTFGGLRRSPWVFVFRGKTAESRARKCAKAYRRVREARDIRRVSVRRVK